MSIEVKNSSNDGFNSQSINLKSYEEMPVRWEEILRYAGCGNGLGEPEETILATMHECYEEFRKVQEYRICYKVAKLEVNNFDSDGQLTFAFDDRTLELNSKDLGANFNRSSSNEVVFFAATLGHGIDRLIRKYSAVSPTRALFMQAIGAERIEELCDAFEKDVMANYSSKAARFSPGFGDFTLEVQTEIAKLLELDKRMGIKLNESRLMSPSKSVTAVIGVRK